VGKKGNKERKKERKEKSQYSKKKKSGIVTRLVGKCFWVRIHCGTVFIIIIITILTVT
jgi:hypothetical protein